jgi:hypothetical protein
MQETKIYCNSQEFRKKIRMMTSTLKGPVLLLPSDFEFIYLTMYFESVNR